MTRRTQIPADALVSDDGPPVEELSGNDGSGRGGWPALEAFRRRLSTTTTASDLPS